MVLKYALSTSFGSLCFASLVSAPAAAINWFFRPEPEEEDGAEADEADGGCCGLCGVDWTLRRWRTEAWEAMQMENTVRGMDGRTWRGARDDTLCGAGRNGQEQNNSGLLDPKGASVVDHRREKAGANAVGGFVRGRQLWGGVMICWRGGVGLGPCMCVLGGGARRGIAGGVRGRVRGADGGHVRVPLLPQRQDGHPPHAAPQVPARPPARLPSSVALRRRASLMRWRRRRRRRRRGSLEGIGSDMSHGAVIRIGALVVSLAAALCAYTLCDSYVDWLNAARDGAAGAAARSGGLVRLVATRMVFGASWVVANLILSFFAGILVDAADAMILLYCVDRDHKTVSRCAIRRPYTCKHAPPLRLCIPGRARRARAREDAGILGGAGPA